MAYGFRISHACALLLASLVSGCGGGSSAVPAERAPEKTTAAALVSQYHVTALQGLGGGFVSGISVSDQDWVSGYSLLSDNATLHAALWYPGSTSATDLGTLGGTNSGVEWPNHTPGTVVGISQIAQSDPLGEQWSCSAFIPYTGQECRGFVWTSGGMTALGTLGGNNSFASGSNARGVVVGWAETATHDATCKAPQVLGFEAAVFDSAGGAHALAAYAQDPDSAATAINNRGDIVGISGICQNAVGGLSAEHMILWRNGVPMSLGTLGGSAWNTPTMIAANDDVVGFSDRAGDQNGNNFNAHAFLWTPANGLSDLGTLAGDAFSYAYGINNRGQIVGQSCTAGCSSSRAFLYQGGVMYDLNALLDTSSSAYDLIYANDINDEGTITGLAVDGNSGSIVGFRLIPNGAASQSSVRASTVRRAGAQRYRFRLSPFGRPIVSGSI